LKLAAKFEFLFNFSFETCCIALTSLESLVLLDQNIKNIKLINYRESKDLLKEGYNVSENYSIIEVEVDMHFPFPINQPRKLFYSISFQYDPKTCTLYRIVKPYLPDSIDPLKLFEKHKFFFKMNENEKEELIDCRLLFVFSLTSIRKLNDDQILFTQINCNFY